MISVYVALCSLQNPSRLTLAQALGGKECYVLHGTDEEAEAQRG